MTFTMKELLGTKALEIVDECPTGKVPYKTKALAQRAVGASNRKSHRIVRAFRCGYCNRYHLGGRR